MMLLGPMSSRRGSRNGGRPGSCPIHGSAGALVSGLGQIVAICIFEKVASQLGGATCKALAMHNRPDVLAQHAVAK